MPRRVHQDAERCLGARHNGVTPACPSASPDLAITPFSRRREPRGGGYNHPPVLRFTENGLSFQGPVARAVQAVPLVRLAVGVPDTAHDLLVNDDAK